MNATLLMLSFLTAETTLIALNQDFDAKLRALSQIESNDNDKAKGRHGELSRYQIKKAVWKQHFPDEKDQRHIPSEARRCAKAHLCWLELKLCLLTKTNHPKPRDVYAAWNLGLKAYGERHYNFAKLPNAIQRRADRFENLYADFRNSQ